MKEKIWMKRYKTLRDKYQTLLLDSMKLVRENEALQKELKERYVDSISNRPGPESPVAEIQGEGEDVASVCKEQEDGCGCV